MNRIKNLVRKRGLNSKYKKCNNLIEQLNGFKQPITFLDLEDTKHKTVSSYICGTKYDYINYDIIEINLETSTIDLTRNGCRNKYKFKINKKENVIMIKSFIIDKKQKLLLEIQIKHEKDQCIYKVELEMFDKNRKYSYEVRNMYI